MYVYIYIYIYIYMYMYICIYYICNYKCMYMYMYIYVYFHYSCSVSGVSHDALVICERELSQPSRRKDFRGRTNERNFTTKKNSLV